MKPRMDAKIRKGYERWYHEWARMNVKEIIDFSCSSVGVDALPELFIQINFT